MRVQEFLCTHGSWIDPRTPGIIETKKVIVRPTIITKPLSHGGNYSEIFAPIIFVQSYNNDDELAAYFETKEYEENAMYLTLYGTSPYIQGLVGREINNKVLHGHDTFLHNTHLHVPGVERGTKPYGGYGPGASSLSIGGKTIALPTLPQRDIYEYIAKPMIEGVASGELIVHERYSDLYEKNVQKIMRIASESSAETAEGQLYVDSHLLRNTDISRYVEVQDGMFYRLLPSKNVPAIVQLSVSEIEKLKGLIELIGHREDFSLEEFKTALYAIPKIEHATEIENKKNQKDFFETVYQLLFGKDSGPKLTTFLYEVDKGSILGLLDIV